MFNNRHSYLWACVMLLLAIGTTMQAAIVTVKWPCVPSSRVNSSIKNSPSKALVVGNVTADNQSSNRIYIKDYSGPVLTHEAIATFWPSIDGGKTYLAWANESSENADRYIEFAVSPMPETTINFSALSMRIGGGGTSYLRANIYYSTDGFATRTLINDCGLPILPQISNETEPLSYSTSFQAVVASGETFSIRIYPYFLRSSSSPKHLYVGDVVLSGNDVADVVSVPQLSTTEITEITSSTAKGGGSIVDNGGASIIQKGLCWSKEPNPTIEGVFGSMEGPGELAFSTPMGSLQGESTYYVRAYATNAAGTGYGPQLEFQTSSLTAFPGAEGFGKYTLGGRGGSVVEVTNLNDSGTGSLRYALESVKGARTIVFRISGTIELKSQLTIKEPHVTIAGQTAPGDGICIRNYPLYILADQVVVRYIRCRLGDTVVGDNDAISLCGVQNLMLDHCSFGWSIDAVADFTDGTGNSTMQWCIVSEALASTNHSKGSHSMGGSWDGLYGGSYHHNLIINCNSRVPRLDGAISPNIFGRNMRDLVDVYNNVFYNWGNGLAYGGENTDVNYRNNYLKYGPATRMDYAYTLFGPNLYCKMFVSGNYVHGSPSVTTDNTKGISMSGSAYSKLSDVLQSSPFDVVEGQIESTQEAYNHVLQYVGALLPRRDAVDNRLVEQVKNSEGKIIASQSEGGGWPLLSSTTPPTDTDHDGMPDAWEVANGLNPNDATDRNEKERATGYTMLECYLNSLCSNSFPTSLPTLQTQTDLKLRQIETSDRNSITMQYELPNESEVRFRLFDSLGSLLETTYSGRQSSGVHTVQLQTPRTASGTLAVVLLETTTLSGEKGEAEAVKIIR